MKKGEAGSKWFILTRFSLCPASPNIMAVDGYTGAGRECDGYTGQVGSGMVTLGQVGSVMVTLGR